MGREEGRGNGSRRGGKKERRGSGEKGRHDGGEERGGVGSGEGGNKHTEEEQGEEMASGRRNKDEVTGQEKETEQEKEKEEKMEERKESFMDADDYFILEEIQAEKDEDPYYFQMEPEMTEGEEEEEEEDPYYFQMEPEMAEGDEEEEEEEEDEEEEEEDEEDSGAYQVPRNSRLRQSWRQNTERSEPKGNLKPNQNNFDSNQNKSIKPAIGTKPSQKHETHDFMASISSSVAATHSSSIPSTT